VDEFQDTNIAQLELLHLLSAEPRNILVVGDNDQSHLPFSAALRSAASSSFWKDSPGGRPARIQPPTA